MARKKPAKKAKKKSAGKAAAKKKSMKKAAKKAAKKTARKKAAKPARRAVAKKKAASPQERRQPRRKRRHQRRRRPQLRQGFRLRKARRKVGGKPKKSARGRTGKKPNLDRPRKTVADIHGIPSSLDANRGASAAKSGRADMKDRLSKNTSASPALTSGDVDADWESADSVGDEAPGGDNPTPDQDVVDDIGRALGVEYEDDEELQGGAEITNRDRHRWELDPASKDDDEEEI